MPYGIKALFFKNKQDKKAKYEAEIYGIFSPYGMVSEYGFKKVDFNDGYVDYMLDVTYDTLFDIIIDHYKSEKEGDSDNMMNYMSENNQPLMRIVLEQERCDRVCLWIYEYD